MCNTCLPTRTYAVPVSRSVLRFVLETVSQSLPLLPTNASCFLAVSHTKGKLTGSNQAADPSGGPETESQTERVPDRAQIELRTSYKRQTLMSLCRDTKIHLVLPV